jgi:hypothetical protein
MGGINCFETVNCFETALGSRYSHDSVVRAQRQL